MKKIIVSFLFLFVTSAFGQKITLNEWNEEAKSNFRLLPKNGLVVKTEEQKQSDKELIESVSKNGTSSKSASDYFVDLGFKYIYRDIKTAMYRFNQAYLFDSTNSDIFWGYGGVYMILGDFERAKEQYQEGLKLNPNNTKILTDYGTYFLSQYYVLNPIDGKSASTYLDSAISYLLTSYKINNENQNTTFKLSVCYWNKNDCTNSRKFFDITKELGGQLITEEFTKAIDETCK